MIAMEVGKRHYFSPHSSSCKEEKILNQKYESFTFKLPQTSIIFLLKQNLADKKSCLSPFRQLQISMMYVCMYV